MAYSPPDLPTALPGEQLPTAIALTLQAEGVSVQPSDTPAPVEPPQETATPIVSLAPPTPTLSATLTVSASDPIFEPTSLPVAVELSEIPNAAVEIRTPGALSRVTSPLSVQTYLRTGAQGRVLFELLGEDSRLLYREVRVVNAVPAGAYVFLVQEIDFEIESTAEVGRLQISTQDEYGRTFAFHSVPLILLSIGEADVFPAVDMLAPIVLQQPQENKLIQGGQITVSGLVRPANDLPLVVKLITSDGREVGARLASVGVPGEQGYATFAVDVPYSVTRFTSALVVVTAGGSGLGDVIHLASVEVRLGP